MSRLDEVQAEITKCNAIWSKSFETGDANLITSVFARNGGTYTSEGILVSGHKAIRDHMANFMKNLGKSKCNIRTVKVWLDRDMAYENGHYEYVYTPAGENEPKSFTGCYFVIWKGTKSGKWKIYRDFGLPTSNHG